MSNVACQQIFDILGSIYIAVHEYQGGEQLMVDISEEAGMKNNFIFETHNSDIKLQTTMALFLAHPVQRRSQSDMLQTIDVSVD
jgi:hypothetical protein